MVETKQVEGINGFALALTRISCQQAFSYGIFDGLDVGQTRTVVPQYLLRPESNVIARTKRSMIWSSSFGIFFIDYDPEDGKPPLTRDQLLKILHEVMPETRNVKKIWLTSASSMIFNTKTGEQLAGEHGQRIYMVVSDAREIERIGDVLYKRLWLNGYGRIMVAKNGHLLDRSVFDKSVYQPCRLDFVAGAMCEPPLQQLRGEPQIIDGEHEFLNVGLISDPTEAEERQFEILIANKKNALKPESERVRNECIERKVCEQPPEKQAEARIKYRAMYEKGLLPDDFELTVFVDGSPEKVTVNSILKNAKKYDKCKTLDPLEPEYNDYDDVGILNLTGSGRPNLYSFAHGDRLYEFADENKPLSGGELIIFGHFQLPQGYFLRNGSIYQLVKSKKEKEEVLVIEHVIAPTKMLQRLSDKRISLEISFVIGKIRDSTIISREVIASNEITDLAAYGIHVNSSNARQLSKFLMAMELANINMMVHSTLVEKLGWLKVGDADYLLVGCNYVKAGEIKPMSESINEKVPFELHFSDSETEQIKRNIETSGTFDKWKLMARRLDPYPYAKIAVIAAIISPMLTKLNLPGFIIHYGYPTSSGKTTILNLAASTFGNPAGDNGGVVRSWNATRVAIERVSAVLHVLPVLLDETKSITAKDKAAFIAETLYQHSLGMSKSRGKPTGVQEQHHWTSIMISTGEANILATVTDGGARARVLDLPDMPFNEVNSEIAEFIDSINDVIQENYGHALLMAMAHLTGDTGRIVDLKARINTINDEIRRLLSAGIGTRLSKIIAVILAGGEVINQCLGLNWNLEDIKMSMVKTCKQSAVHGTEGRRALELMYNFSVSNRSRNENCIPGELILNNGAMAGFIRDETVCFIHPEFKKILKSNNFEPDAVLKEWDQRGWIDSGNSKDHPHLKQIKIHGSKPWCVVINEKTMASLEAEFHSETESNSASLCEYCPPPREFCEPDDLPDCAWLELKALDDKYTERIRKILEYEAPMLSVWCSNKLRSRFYGGSRLRATM